MRLTAGQRGRQGPGTGRRRGEQGFNQRTALVQGNGKQPAPAMADDGATHATLQTQEQETQIYRAVEENSHDVKPRRLLGFAMQFLFPLQETRLSTHPCLPGPPFQDKTRRWLQSAVPGSPRSFPLLVRFLRDDCVLVSKDLEAWLLHAS